MAEVDPKPAAPKPAPAPEKPYEQASVTPTEPAMKEWKSVLVNGDWIFSGDCPRCGHRWEKAITEEVMVMAFEADLPEPDDALSESDNEGVHVVVCNCTHAHPERPDEVSVGCGAYWGIRVRRPPSGGAAP
jgi:hypothetical protein